ncbi:MAG: hypothetical protein ACI3X6_02455 [Alloprevotella sp.]
MEKKIYISPEISVFPMDYEGVLAGSTGTDLGDISVKAGEDNYTDAPDCTNKKEWDDLSGLHHSMWE